MNKEKRKKKKKQLLVPFCKDILVFECLRDFSSFKTNRHENLMYMNTAINKAGMKRNKFRTGSVFCFKKNKQKKQFSKK